MIDEISNIAQHTDICGAAVSIYCTNCSKSASVYTKEGRILEKATSACFTGKHWKTKCMRYHFGKSRIVEFDISDRMMSLSKAVGFACEIGLDKKNISSYITLALQSWNDISIDDARKKFRGFLNPDYKHLLK